MFASALIVFRETLEAALLIGIVAAATRGLPGRLAWLAAGIAGGLAGSVVVALGADGIAQAVHGAGQELFNAGVLGLAVLMLGWHNMWMSRPGAEMARQARRVAADVRSGRGELSAVGVVVALTVLREGSETVLFLYGTAVDQGAAAILAGGMLGLVGGAAVGLVVYGGLLRIPLRWFFLVTNGLVLLLAAGMAGQMARLLIQGDLLPALGSPVWDSSAWLPAGSTLGSTLRVLLGYDAHPAGLQVVFYGVTLAAISLGMALTRRRPASKAEGRR